MVKFLDLKSQYESISTEIDDAIKAVINESAFIGGKYVEKFEKEFAEYCESDFCIGVGNGTDALEIAIEALGLPQGSEIIVPGNSFIASSEAVTRTGHRVVFCDVDPDTYVIDAECVRPHITDSTKAIIAVHLYGHPAEMSSLLELAKQFDLKIIEDCAQAHGALHNNRKVGSIGDIAAFSFYPGKNLGAYGDGGAILTNDESFAIKSRMIANHGRIAKYDHEFEGRNSRLDGIQAAILSVKLKYLEIWTDRRIMIADRYISEFKDSTNIILQERSDQVKQVYHLFVIRVKERDGLKEYLLKHGIQTGIHYPIALPNLHAYKYLETKNNQEYMCNTMGSNLLSLPIGEHITDSDVNHVVLSVKEFFNRDE